MACRTWDSQRRYSYNLLLLDLKRAIVWRRGPVPVDCAGSWAVEPTELVFGNERMCYSDLIVAQNLGMGKVHD